MLPCGSSLPTVSCKASLTYLHKHCAEEIQNTALMASAFALRLAVLGGFGVLAILQNDTTSLCLEDFLEEHIGAGSSISETLWQISCNRAGDLVSDQLDKVLISPVGVLRPICSSDLAQPVVAKSIPGFTLSYIYIY